MEDFWRMVNDKNCPVIVVLSHFDETVSSHIYLSNIDIIKMLFTSTNSGLPLFRGNYADLKKKLKKIFWGGGKIFFFFLRIKIFGSQFMQII